MEKKTVYELKGKYTKEEIQRHKFKLNQKHAKPFLLVTSSRYWYKLFCNKPYLFRLHWLLIKTKKIREGGNELIDIMFDKLHAIHEQNWELAAALRHSELEMEHAFMQKHKINKIDVKYTTVNNGKRNLGIFHVEKQFKKNKNMDATKNEEVQKFLNKIHNEDVIRVDIDDIQPFYEKHKSVTYRQVNVTDLENYPEFKKFVNQILKENISIKAICLHINDFCVNEISMHVIGEITDITSYLDSSADILWGYARKQPLKNTPDHIEISMLLFSDKH